MENLDKQIIIDGVDVIGCEYFHDSGNYNCRGCRWCKDIPNCSYKQSKRLLNLFDEFTKKVQAFNIRKEGDC